MHELINKLLEFHGEKSRALFDIQAVLDDLERHEQRARAGLRKLYRSFETDAEAAHHRNEELILRVLRESGAPIHSRIDGMSDEHQAFHRIVAGISAMIDDSSVEPAVLAAEIRRFIALYNDHASNEELIFFPEADKYLTDEHWEQIRAAWVG